MRTAPLLSWASETDLLEVEALMLSAAAAPAADVTTLLRQVRLDRCDILVARDDHLAGFIAGNRLVGHIAAVVVDPLVRGIGVGTDLLARFTAACSLTPDTWADAASVPFFTRAGWLPTGRTRMNVYGASSTVVELRARARLMAAAA